MDVDDNVRVLGTLVGPTTATWVFHGADPNVARPTNAGVVVWVGSVEPVNGVGGTDFRINTP